MTTDLTDEFDRITSYNVCYTKLLRAIMGAAILCAGIGWLTRVDPLARLELIYLIQPFWAIWLGFVIWQQTGHIEQATDSTAVVEHLAST